MHHRVRTEHLIKKLRVNELRGEISFYPLPFVRSRANFGEWILKHRRVGREREREMDGKRDVTSLFSSLFLLLSFLFFVRFEEFERKGFEFGSNYILVSLFSVQSLIGSVSIKDHLDIFEVVLYTERTRIIKNFPLLLSTIILNNSF